MPELDRTPVLTREQLPVEINSRFAYWSVAVGLLALFAVVNLSCLSEFPTVWGDEVMQIDPGLNLAAGTGWVSRAWFSQSAHEFWAANNPLYPALLSFWIRMFGTTITAVRSFNLFEYSLATLVLLSAANMISLLKQTSSMVVFIFVMSCSGIMSFIYRSGRSDMTTMLICSAVVWGYCYAKTSSRYTPLFLASLLVTAAGIQSLPYLAALACTDWLISRGELKPILIGLIGTVAGGVGLIAIMVANGAFNAFVSNTFASGYSILGATLQYFAIHDLKAKMRLGLVLATMSPGNILQSMTADAVLAGTLIVLIVVNATLLFNRSFKIRSASGVGLVLAVAVPLFVTASGHYATYYRWMSVAPLVLCTVATLEAFRGPRWLAGGCAVCLVAGAALGLPRELYRNYQDRDSRDYSKVSRYLQRNVDPRATVYGDAAVYYAARNLGYNFYTDSYGGGRLYPKPTEADTFSTLIIRRVDLADVTAKSGGKWIEMPETLDTCSAARPLTDLDGIPRCYSLWVYQRVR